MKKKKGYRRRIKIVIFEVSIGMPEIKAVLLSKYYEIVKKKN
jgi:hypothetical protein